MNRIYLDHAASTPLLPEVIDTMITSARHVNGNPSSIHREGVLAKNIIEESRKSLAQFLHTSPSQVFFTSSATESNNFIIHSAVQAGNIKNIITSPIEHPAILNAIKFYNRNNNINISYLTPDSTGIIDLNELEEKLKVFGKGTLVCLIHIHNELGTMLPLVEVAQLCATYGADLHSDTVQSIGLMDVDVNVPGLTSIVGSAHKFNGPKGVGFVYLKDSSHYHPLLYGGPKERNMRA
ncbi:MAG: aminotransferase class V-fold PLP-dependent enzyme, partial [Saprospiraceae bacterium]|nr:aminotransferase class V-fold PLP-dependent enzyme [Saprospiraceae bacterium]